MRRNREEVSARNWYDIERGAIAPLFLYVSRENY